MMEINEAIVNILYGKSYRLPTLPIADKLYDQIDKDGIEKAIALYDS